MPLHVSSTMCSSLGGQNCYTASGIISPVGGRPVHRLREDNFDLMSTYCSKHVEAYNKLIIKQEFVQLLR